MARQKISGQRGYEYFLSESGKELAPIIQQIGEWGMRWTRSQLPDSELDIELLMLYLERSINPHNLPGDNTIISFNFSDQNQMAKWWIVVSNEEVDVCTVDPGKEVDIWFNTDLRTMIEIWMGYTTYKTAIRAQKLQLIGPSALTNNINSWMDSSVFAEIPAANEI